VDDGKVDVVAVGGGVLEQGVHGGVGGGDFLLGADGVALAVAGGGGEVGEHAAELVGGDGGGRRAGGAAGAGGGVGEPGGGAVLGARGGAVGDGLDEQAVPADAVVGVGGGEVEAVEGADLDVEAGELALEELPEEGVLAALGAELDGAARGAALGGEGLGGFG